MPPYLLSLGFINFHKKYFYKRAELKIVQYFPKSEVIGEYLTILGTASL